MSSHISHYSHSFSCYLWGGYSSTKKLSKGAIDFIDMHINNDCNRSSDAFVAKTKHGGSLHFVAFFDVLQRWAGRESLLGLVLTFRSHVEDIVEAPKQDATEPNRKEHSAPLKEHR